MWQALAAVDDLAVFKAALAVVLAAFVPISAATFVYGRVLKKRNEVERLARWAQLPNQGGAARLVDEEFRGSSYVVPVVSATAIVVLGLISLLFGAGLVASHLQDPSLLLDGVFDFDDPVERAGLRRQSIVVLAFAFVGAYIWSCQNIIRRFVAADLAPIEYFHASLRMVIAPLLSLLLSFLLYALPFTDYSKTLLPVIAFLTGMVPGAALLYLQQNITIFDKWRESSADPLELRMIEGLNRYHEVRLQESGIDNMQNLAEAHIFDLILQTPYSPLQLIDWIAQAKLLVYVKDGGEPLRKVGVRSSFDLRGADGERIDDLVAETGISRPTLDGIRQCLAADPGLDELWRLRSDLSRLLPPEQRGDGADGATVGSGPRTPVDRRAA